MALPHGFVYLKDVDPSITQDVKYFTDDNFVGRPINGYEAAECILTQEAALALFKIQAELKQQSLGLKVFDCYRPQMAVDDFIAWSKNPADQKMKKGFYPKVDKADLFKLGYLATRSSHTRGSTVDLTMVHLHSSQQKQTEMAMGTSFDYLDELSHPLSSQVQAIHQQNRLILRNVMVHAGFIPYDKEWWHFTLRNEPFPNEYFNFPVVASGKSGALNHDQGRA